MNPEPSRAFDVGREFDAILSNPRKSELPVGPTAPHAYWSAKYGRELGPEELSDISHNLKRLANLVGRLSAQLNIV